MKAGAFDNWAFIDALRGVLGLVPLYRSASDRPSYERRALADMSCAIGDGNRRVVTTVGLEQSGRHSESALGEDVRELTPRELARLRKQRPLSRGARRLNGQRVGLAFVTLGRRA